jgi:hypothetical protein
VIALNAIWVVESIALFWMESIDPNLFGYAFVIAQAIVVGIFAELEYLGLRKASGVAA